MLSWQLVFRHFRVQKNGTSGAKHENQRTVLESVTENFGCFAKKHIFKLVCHKIQLYASRAHFFKVFGFQGTLASSDTLLESITFHSYIILEAIIVDNVLVFLFVQRGGSK